MAHPSRPSEGVVPRPPELPQRDDPVGSDSDGSNARQQEPDPAADRRRRAQDDGRQVRGPYPTGNI